MKLLVVLFVCLGHINCQDKEEEDGKNLNFDQRCVDYSYKCQLDQEWGSVAEQACDDWLVFHKCPRLCGKCVDDDKIGDNDVFEEESEEAYNGPTPDPLSLHKLHVVSSSASSCQDLEKNTPYKMIDGIADDSSCFIGENVDGDWAMISFAQKSYVKNVNILPAEGTADLLVGMKLLVCESDHTCRECNTVKDAAEGNYTSVACKKGAEGSYLKIFSMEKIQICEVEIMGKASGSDLRIKQAVFGSAFDFAGYRYEIENAIKGPQVPNLIGACYMSGTEGPEAAAYMFLDSETRVENVNILLPNSGHSFNNIKVEICQDTCNPCETISNAINGQWNVVNCHKQPGFYIRVSGPEAADVPLVICGFEVDGYPSDIEFLPLFAASTYRIHPSYPINRLVDGVAYENYGSSLLAHSQDASQWSAVHLEEEATVKRVFALNYYHATVWDRLANYQLWVCETYADCVQCDGFPDPKLGWNMAECFEDKKGIFVQFRYTTAFNANEVLVYGKRDAKAPKIVDNVVTSASMYWTPSQTAWSLVGLVNRESISSYDGWTCYCSWHNQEQFLQVNLEEELSISRVAVLNRQAGSTRIAGITVSVCIDDECEPCGQFQESQAGQWLSLECAGKRGTSVRFDETGDHINFCQVFVYANEIEDERVIKYIPITSSSSSGEYAKYYKELGYNGIGYNYVANERDCFFSDPSNNDWVVFNLERSAEITSISWLNRREYRPERILGASIYACDENLECGDPCITLTSLPEEHAYIDWLSIECGNKNATSIKFQAAAGTDRYLTLCEVMVYGY